MLKHNENVPFAIIKFFFCCFGKSIAYRDIFIRYKNNFYLKLFSIDVTGQKANRNKNTIERYF